MVAVAKTLMYSLWLNMAMISTEIFIITTRYFRYLLMTLFLSSVSNSFTLTVSVYTNAM